MLQRFLPAVIAYCLLTCLSVAFADENLSSEKLTLTQAVTKTIEHFPQVQAEEYGLRSAKALKRQALLGYLPSVGTDFSMNKGDDPVYVFGSLVKQQSLASSNLSASALNYPSPLVNYQTGVEVSLPVFSGLQTEGRIRSADFSVKMSQSLKEGVSQEAAFSAVNQYIHILSLNRILDLTKATIVSAEEAVKEAENLKEKGMVLGCDYLTARAILSQIKEEEEKIKYQKHAAENSLNILMGTGENNQPVPDALFPPEVFPEINADDFKKASLELRKDREAAQYRFKTAQSELERERNSRLPKIDAFARGENNTHDFTSSGNSYLFGARFHMYIFEPRLPAKVDRMAAEAGRLKSMVSQIDDSISDALQEALAQYNAQNQRLGFSRQSMVDGREAEKSIAELYRAGKRTIADVLKAQSYKLSLETSYWQARYNAYLNYARLFFVSGKLNDASIKDLESLLTASQE